MKIIKAETGIYYIQTGSPGNLLSRKDNNTRKIWAETIQELFNFDVNEVEFVYDILNIENDVIIAEFTNFNTYKEELAEYLI